MVEDSGGTGPEAAAADEGIHEREARLRSILETVPDAIIVIDEQGLMVDFSPAAERLFGYRKADVQGRNVSLLMPSPKPERAAYPIWSDYRSQPVLSPVMIECARERIKPVSSRGSYTFRKERVHLFRPRTPPDSVGRLFLEYLRAINELGKRPRFYNTLSTNCTTQIRVAGLAAEAVIPWNWRLLLTGHTPDYLYLRGSVDTGISLEELYRRAQINEAAVRAGDNESFSAVIREEVPDPLR